MVITNRRGEGLGGKGLSFFRLLPLEYYTQLGSLPRQLSGICAFILSFIRFFNTVNPLTKVWVSAPSNFLAKICAGSNKVSRCAKLLEKAGLIQIDHSYKVGAFCKKWRLSPHLAGETWSKADFISFVNQGKGIKLRYDYWENFEKELTSWKDLPEDHPCKEIGQFVAQNLEHVTIEYNEEVESEIQTLAAETQKANEADLVKDNVEIEKKNVKRAAFGHKLKPFLALGTTTESIAATYRDSILAFSESDTKYVKFHLDKGEKRGTGRLFTNITNLKSNFRKHLRYKGQKLINCDIRCAQICLLSLFYKDSEDHLAEKARFIDFVTNKDFYSELAARATGNLTRKEAKQQSFILLFAQNYTAEKQPFYKVFKELFPILANEISLIKESDYKKVAFEMQSGESRIMITGTLLDLARLNIPVFSIHDSILCLPEHLETVKDCISQNFLKQTGFLPVLKTDV